MCIMQVVMQELVHGDNGCENVVKLKLQLDKLEGHLRNEGISLKGGLKA